MFIIKLLRWLRGFVIFTATGGFPERFMNLALREDITLIDPIGEKGKLTAQVSIKEYKELRQIRKVTGVKLKIIQKKGLPFFIYKNRGRWGLAFGLVIFMIILNVMSMFVWTVEISGIDNFSEAQVRTVLAENGVYQGAYKGSINVLKLKQDVPLALGNVGWMAVNIVGSTATVEISEGVEKPEIVPADQPCNIKASAEGQIIRMAVSSGSSAVKIGDGVAKGQLLVSGIITDEISTLSSFVHSEAKIYVSRESSAAVVIPQEREMFMPSGNITVRKEAVVFGAHIPFAFASQPSKDYRIKDSYETVIVNENNLPINLHTESLYEFDSVKKKYSEKEIKNLSDTQIILHDVFALWDKDIQKKTVTKEKDNNQYIFNILYSCIEDIAEKSPISISE